MKNKNAMFRSTFGALAIAAMLVAPLGCVGADESTELVGEAAEALNTPLLVATPSPVDFGTIPRGTTSTLAVTLTNAGDEQAVDITLAYPPDPYRATHNPPSVLPVGASSNAMQITFYPSVMEGARSYSSTVVVTYKSVAGVSYTLNIPVTGTSS